MKTASSVRKTSLRAAALCLVAIAAFLVVLTLPVYQFSNTLYTKKSGNTFPGDERYTAARADADAAAAQYQGQPGFSGVSVSEETTQRVNSKGETTSLMTFRVSAVTERTGWAFIASGLPSGKVLLAALLCALAGVALVAATLPGTLDTAPGRLSRQTTLLRKTACTLALSLLLAGALALTAVAAWALLSGRRSLVAGVWQRWRERAQHVARAGNRVRPPWMREGPLASRAAARDVTDVVPREVRPARGP